MIKIPEFLKDQNNKKSSKRLWGSICIGTGILIALAVTAVYLIAVLKDNADTINIEQLRIIFNTVFTAGTALLGVGVLEKRKNNENTKNNS
jgi:hypothetical protein